MTLRKAAGFRGFADGAFGVVQYPRVMRMRFRASSVSVMFVAFAPGAMAADWYTGSPSTPRASAPVAALDLSLSGTSQNSMHGAAIGTIAPFATLKDTGARLRLQGVLGHYDYIATTAGVGRVRGDQASGSFLVGYEWVMRDATVAIWAGADAASNKLDKYDPLNTTAGTTFGAKIAADFYVNPTSFTMASGNLSYSTAHGAYFARFKAGVAIADRVFVGPEAQFLGDDFYGQWRIGAHISGVTLGPVQFGLSAGYVNDRVRGSGAYGVFDTRIAF